MTAIGRQAGFTLAELLVALVVGGVLLSVGVPSYTAFARNANQVSSANELLSSLHSARDLAITRNTRVVACASAGGANCEATTWDNGWIVFADADDSRTVSGAEVLERVNSSIPVRSATSVEFPSVLVFRPNGRVMANAVDENTGEITLCDERGAEHARVIIVEMSGRPRISRTRSDQSQPVCPAV